jgi:hypothetical protein
MLQLCMECALAMSIAVMTRLPLFFFSPSSEHVARHSAYPGSLGMKTLDSPVPPLVPSPCLLSTAFFGGHHSFCDALDCIGQVCRLGVVLNRPRLCISLMLQDRAEIEYIIQNQEQTCADIHGLM